MFRLRSSKLWQAIRRKSKQELQSELRAAVKKPAFSRPPNNIKLPVEILEMIFVYLDMWSLMRCRNVCRIWNNIVPGNSANLRLRMFLPTISTDNFLPKLLLNTEIEPARLTFTVEFTDTFANTRDPQPATEYTVSTREKREETYSWEYNFHDYNPIIFLDMSQSQLRRYKATLAAAADGLYPLPLWMGMYATYPPARTMAMRFAFSGTRIVCEECWVQQRRTDAEIEESQGITVGRVLEAVGDAMWRPDLILSKDGEQRIVRILPREEGEKTSLQKEIRAAERKVKVTRNFLPQFEWEE